MAVRVAPKTETVARSVPRQDGGWMVLTTKGHSGSSPVELPEGAHIIIENGIARRAS